MNERAKKWNVDDYAILKNHTKCADAKNTRNPSHQCGRKDLKLDRRVGDDVEKIANKKML